MTPSEAIHNFQVIAEKYQGPLSHHQAIGQSISVLRAFIEENTPKEVPVESSAGGSVIPSAGEEFFASRTEAKQAKNRKKKASRKK
jgi:hypothetical protein